MKTVAFFNLTSPKTMVTLPPVFEGALVNATVIFWTAEGINYNINNDGNIVEPFYFQVKFGQGFRGGNITYGGNPDMIQLPLQVFNGWNPPGGSFPIPIARNHHLGSRLPIELFGEGEAPSPIPFLPGLGRVLLWIELETISQDGPGSGSTSLNQV